MIGWRNLRILLLVGWINLLAACIVIMTAILLPWWLVPVGEFDVFIMWGVGGLGVLTLTLVNLRYSGYGQRIEELGLLRTMMFWEEPPPRAPPG